MQDRPPRQDVGHLLAFPDPLFSNSESEASQVASRRKHPDQRSAGTEGASNSTQAHSKPAQRRDTRLRADGDEMMDQSRQQLVAAWIDQCGYIAQAVFEGMVPHRTDRQELFAEWCVKVWRLIKRGGHTKVVNREAFTVRMAQNLARSFLTRLKRRRRVVSIDLVRLTVADPRDSFAGLQVEDILGELRKLVDPQVVEAFVLVHRLRYKFAETAKELGHPESTIRRWVRKAELIYCQLAGEPLPGCASLNAPAQVHAAGRPSNPRPSDAGPVR
jgi:DNA-directed RNA polymerase specialized sigma24 family protein